MALLTQAKPFKQLNNQEKSQRGTVVTLTASLPLYQGAPLTVTNISDDHNATFHFRGCAVV